MTELFINPASKLIIDSFADKLPQSLLLTGDEGIGLCTVAKYISTLQKTKPLVILPEKDEKIDLEKGIISVDIIRRMYLDTRTKVSKKRIIIIDYAERMTHQAQNAFLKLLEEPNDSTYFIILSHSMSNLLPTIISRTQTIKLRPISHEQSERLLDDMNITDMTKRVQLLFIAEGLPAELTRLASDENYFKIRSQTVIDARDFLRADTYQKLKISQKYKDNRQLALRMLLDTANILRKSVSQKPQKDVFEKINAILDAHEAIEANANIRLALSTIVL